MRVVTRLAFAVCLAATLAAAQTTTTNTTLPSCGNMQRLDAFTNDVLSGRLTVAQSCGDELMKFALTDAPSANLQVNLRGDFLYQAPSDETAEVFQATVSCGSVPKCTLRIGASTSRRVTAGPTPPPLTNAPAPSVDRACPQIFYQVELAGSVSDSLSTARNQVPCAGTRNFNRTRGPTRGQLTLTPYGDFRYDAPPTAPVGTDITQLVDEFDYTYSCNGYLVCTGATYVTFTNPTPAPTMAPWTDAPGGVPGGPTAAPNSGPFVQPRPFMQCRGTCDADAWKAVHSDPTAWDTSVAPPRTDGKPTDAIESSWENGNLVLRAYSKIGNVGIRFPAFEEVLVKANEYFTGEEQRARLVDTSLPFDLNCLNAQSASGVAEDVWEWVSVVNRTGHVGRHYASGYNWYQKFGGKHVNCDTFLADSCHYAPLLTPRRQQDPAAGGVWSVVIDGCDVTWTGVFSFAAIRNMRRRDGTPIFSVANGTYVRTTILNEVLKPTSFVQPAMGVLTKVATRPVALSLEPWVTATVDEANRRLFAIDVEYFTYTESNGDKAFGLNLLFYPHVEDDATTSYSPDRHVSGWRWISQAWSHPDSMQCPTCTGTDTVCELDSENLLGDGSFMSKELMAGTCLNPRVNLRRGPSFDVDACGANQMYNLNQPGFSAPRYCRTSFQNLTVRGIATGSAGSAMNGQSFSFDGSVDLQLLLDNGQKPTVAINFGMVVAMASVDGDFTGASGVCRSAPYWPVFDPLGTSTPDRPMALDDVAPVELCIDREDRTFGPTGWALVSFNVDGVSYSQVSVESLFVKYPSSPKVFLLRADPATGQPLTTLPDADSVWWSDEYPFLNFRDLTDRLPNQTFPVGAEVQPITDADYAFAFTPGAIGTSGQVTVNAVLRIQEPNSTRVRRVVFTRMLISDNTLTARSRYGPPVVTATEVVEAAHNQVFAMAVTGGLITALFVVGIMVAVADTNRPLPKWMPRKLKLTKMIPIPLPGRAKPAAKKRAHAPGSPASFSAQVAKASPSPSPRPQGA